MATLQKIRKQSVLLLVVIGLAMLAFILGDFLTSGSSLFRMQQENIVKINGKNLNYKDYEARIAEMEEVYKMQTGLSNLDEQTTAQIRETVYESIVRENLLDEQASALGIQVTEKEIFEALNSENPPYMVAQMPFFLNPETGRYDRSLMINFLRTIEADDMSMYSEDAQAQIKQMKNYWLFWENMIQYNMLEDKISNLLSHAVSASSVDAKSAFDARQRSVDFVCAVKPYFQIPDSTVKVSSNEVKAYYRAHKEEFRQQPYRSASYVTVDVLSSQEDNDAVKAEMDRASEEFASAEDIASLVNSKSDIPYTDCFVATNAFTGSVADFLASAKDGQVEGPYFEDNAWIMLRQMASITRPDSVQVSQIFIAGKQKDNQKLIDSLMNVLKSGKTPFAELAANYSQDQTAQNGGEMGWFREIDAFSSLGAEFVNTCFTAKKNQLYTAESKYGTHILKVTDMTKPVKKVKLAEMVMAVSPSSRTYSSYYNQLNQILANNQTADAFIAAARENGYQVLSAPSVLKNDYTLAGIEGMRQAVRFIYNGKVGDVSTIFENSNNQFVVVAVTGAFDEDYRPMSEVQNQLVRIVANEKKAAKFKKEFKAEEGIEALAEAYEMVLDTVRLLTFSSRRITGIGEEPALQAAVMAAPLNEVSKPIAGENGIYVFEAISDVLAESAFDEQLEKTGWNANETYRVLYQAYAAVLDEAEVEDSRIRFY